MKTFKEYIAETVKPHEAVVSDTHSKKGDVHTFRRGFFYTGGGTSEKYAHHVSAQLHAAGIKHDVVDHGEKRAAFRGGAPVHKKSHWWVKVKVHKGDK